jgi:rhamnosyltransferase
LINQPLTASVVIPVKNGGDRCLEMLSAVLGQQGNQLLEVIVVDSGSTDGSPERIAALFADATSNPRSVPLRHLFIEPGDYGHGRTRNMAVEMARGDVAVLLSQDVTPLGTGWLSALLEPFIDPRVAGTFSRQVGRPDGTLYESALLEISFPPQSRRITQQAPEGTFALFSDAAGAIRRSVWQDTHYEDVISCEDQIWARSMLKRGYAIQYVAAAEVLHSHRIGVRSWLGRYFDNGVGETAQPPLASTVKRRASVVRPLVGLVRRLFYLARYAGRHGSSRDVVFALCMEPIATAGHVLGWYHTHLPRRLCRLLTEQPHWFTEEARAVGQRRKPH